MVINFRARGTSRGARKLTRTLMLIQKKITQICTQIFFLITP
jgi:hypothetical protein